MFLLCDNCGSNEIIVIDSRPYENYIHRRRRCAKCKKTVSTKEILDNDYKRMRNIEKNIIELIKNFIERLPAKDQIEFQSKLAE